MPLGNDCIFSYDQFIEKYNVDLANDLGNLVSRTIAMINKYFGGQVQKPDSDHFPEDADFRKTAEKAIADYLSDFANFRDPKRDYRRLEFGQPQQQIHRRDHALGAREG